MEKFENAQHNADMAVSTKCISEIIAKLECGKSAGPDGICAEYLKFSNVKLHTLLALCFSLCLSHGYLPIALLETTIVPMYLAAYQIKIIIGQLPLLLLFKKH